MSISRTIPAPGVAGVDTALAAQIDATVEEWIAANEVPSASIAIVRDGKLAHARAYGAARLSPHVAATTSTRYPIYSIAKQFTAAAILVLAEDERLGLDDRAGKHLAGLGPAADVTLRQLLTHTGGVVDYWTQDYVPLHMQRPATRQDIICEWAHRPLEFAPGSHWQYSNTGYVILGAIIERLAGKSLYAFLEERVFAPLDMRRVTECDSAPLDGKDAAGYTRVVEGPLRLAPREARGWLFAACDLVMTPTELAKWNVALLDRSILAPDLLAQALSPVVLSNGRLTGYGFGVVIDQVAGRRRIGHDGIGSGFLTENRIWPRTARRSLS
ncbi:MAG: serine hydrolase domain-containing protein [Alphaproteobacteria bacterium]